MKSFQIEAWAREVIRRVMAGEPNEDFRVELKSEWPETFKKTARQLAAHANTARGETVLWLIGVDQKSRIVTGASHMEVATWYDQLRAEFDERFAPSLKDLNFDYDGKTIVALVFDTERFPFVVKASEDRLEVPWREGTSTRSAKRSDLFKLLGPLQSLPSIEVLDGEINLQRSNDSLLYWTVSITLYFEPRGDATLVIPFHRSTAVMELAGTGERVPMKDLRLRPPAIYSRVLSSTIESTQDEILVHGPGRAEFSASADLSEPSGGTAGHVDMDISLLPVGAEHPVTISNRFTAKSEPTRASNIVKTWELSKDWAKG